MDALFKKDLEGYNIFNVNIFKIIKIIIINESVKCIYIHRKIVHHYKKNNKIRYYFWTWYKLHLRMTVSIDSHADIGGGLKFIHPYNINIGNVKIGNNCTIYQGVTIGANYKIGMDGQKYPTIGNCVKISPGAVILGPVTIGSNVVVGTNSVVLNDVNDNCVVGGIPAKVIGEYDHERFG